MTPHPASSFVGLSDAELPNQEVVLAASYDRYGTRLATASADHRIRMYDLDEKTGQWALTDVWRGHNGLCEDVSCSAILFPSILLSPDTKPQLPAYFLLIFLQLKQPQLTRTSSPLSRFSSHPTSPPSLPPSAQISN